MTTDEKFAALESRIAALENRISKNLPPETVDEVMATNERILLNDAQRLANSMLMSDKPQFFVAASPFTAVELDDIFESSSQAVKLFENPVVIREDGFNPNPGDRRSQIIDGRVREVRIGTQARQIFRDGRFIAMFPGDDSFLGWAMKSSGWPMSSAQENTPWRINSLVLIEATYLSVLLANSLLKLAKPSGAPIQYSIGLKNMKYKDQGPLILNGKADRNLHQYPQVQADFESGVFSLLPVENDKPERVSFKLVAEIYRRFGIPDDRIPYSEIIDGQRRLVPSAF